MGIRDRLNTSVVPIYFNAINTGASSADLVVAWGNAQTIASLVIAMLMPILGALADYAGNKIKFFLGFFLTGLVLCLAQAIPMSAMAFLTVYVPVSYTHLYRSRESAARSQSERNRRQRRGCCSSGSTRGCRPCLLYTSLHVARPYARSCPGRL